MHCERLARYSIELAHALGLPKQEQLALFRGGYLHDIGKIAIPDAILLKPGPLTDAEFSIMQQHTLLGERILTRLEQQQPHVSMFSMAVRIARSHHECFDGSGYPDGLSGRSIPLAARIVKVADVFDAITSARVYKPKQHPDEAREWITARTGAATTRPAPRGGEKQADSRSLRHTPYSRSPHLFQRLNRASRSGCCRSDRQKMPRRSLNLPCKELSCRVRWSPLPPSKPCCRRSKYQNRWRFEYRRRARLP